MCLNSQTSHSSTSNPFTESNTGPVCFRSFDNAVISLHFTNKKVHFVCTVFYNNNNPGTIVWHDERHEENYRDNSQFRGGPVPIILGHIPPAGQGTGVHYIYALFDNEIGSFRKKKQTKRKKGKKRKRRQSLTRFK